MKTYYNGSSDFYSPRASRPSYPVYRSTYNTHIPNYQYASPKKYDTYDSRSYSKHRSPSTATNSGDLYNYRRRDAPLNSYSLYSTFMPKTDHLSYLGSGRLSYQHLMDQIAQITDHLYLSSMSAINSERMRELNITMIVSIVNEAPPLRSKYIENVLVPIEDNEYANIRSYFDRIIEKMHKEEMKGGKILVHCVAGVSRSASMVMAYLMKHKAMRLRTAYNHVRTRRPYIQPNIGFWKQLIDFEKRLFGSSSVKLLPHNGEKMTLYPDVPPSALSLVIGQRCSGSRAVTRYH